MISSKKGLLFILITLILIVNMISFEKYSQASTSTKISSKKIVMGFTTFYSKNDNQSYNSILRNTKFINEIITYTYTTDAYGRLKGVIPKNQINYAKGKGIKPVALITNNFDSKAVHTLLQYQKNRQALINNIMNELKINGYSGVNIDFEFVYYYDRKYYTQFILELYKKIRTKGYTLNISVPAKTSDSIYNKWSGAYDFVKISPYVHRVILMAYDEHYIGGPSGPIASIKWVENSIKYAISILPKSKVVLGTAAFGYDWSSNGTKGLSINAASALAAKYKSPIKWDSVSKSPYFKYKDNKGVYHTVWFESGESLGYKLDLVNKYNILGIAIWRLGLENSSYWNVIGSKLLNN